MANGDDATRAVFDPGLLGSAETLLRGKPEQQAVSSANALQIDVSAFGQVPGGAEAGARLQAFATRARTELTGVSTEVANLASGTGTARHLATDVDPETQSVARRGASSGGTGGW